MKGQIYISTTLLRHLDLYELQRWAQEAKLVLLDQTYTTENREVQIRMKSTCPTISTKSTTQILSVQPDSMLVVPDTMQLPQIYWQFELTCLVGDSICQCTSTTMIHVSTLHEARNISNMAQQSRRQYFEFNKKIDQKIDQFKNRDAEDNIRRMAQCVSTKLKSDKTRVLIKTIRQLILVINLVEQKILKTKEKVINGWRILMLQKSIEKQHMNMIQMTMEEDRKMKLLRKAFDGLKIPYVKY